MPWPSRAPDLNPMENLWSIVARAVYKDARQFVGKDDLKAAIIEAWNTLPEEVLRTLIESMHRLFEAVIARRGDKIDY